MHLARWLLLSGLLLRRATEAITLPSAYDTVWTSQSNNSAGSMPVGGGDVGLNVWVEEGEILFYVAKGGAFDENNSLLKLGRVRLTFEPNPFSVNASSFKQHLYINDGYVNISGDYQTTVSIWVDMKTSDVHASVTSQTTLNLTAAFESWRTTEYQMVPEQQQQTSWGNDLFRQIPLPDQTPDTVEFSNGGVLSYHVNKNEVLLEWQAKQQGLGDPAAYYSPMRNNIFGAFMYSPQLQTGHITRSKYLSTNYTAYSLVSARRSNSFQLVVGNSQEQTMQSQDFIDKLIGATHDALHASQTATLSWWHAFWDRSWIVINPSAPVTDPGFQVGKNYQYFRYMMACNANGAFPTKWNGGLFTFDPVLTDARKPFTPDYREWGGGTFTAQNQRLLYWPLLKSGDFDIMRQQFNFYSNIASNSRKLGQLYFGLDVALTSEQIDNTGLPNLGYYDSILYGQGKQRTELYPPGIDFNDYISWLIDTANEFADMILMSHSFSGQSIQPWMTFVEYQLAWFDEYYQKRNGLNHSELVIYPGSGCETYKLALNPASTVSGLRRTITDLLAVAESLDYVKGNRTYYEQYRARVPQTPLRPCPGATGLTCISPAWNYSYTENTEPVALYPVFPWGEYGLGQPTTLDFAVHAYFNDSESANFHGSVGWRQDQIWWARMGLTDLVTQNTISRLSDSSTYRFSAFKGPNYDWSPDLNHYGSAAIGLQEMILQTFAINNTQIRLLPAFPSDWTGSFKLLAPQQTVVQGDLTGVSVENLVISPSSRMQDVVWGTNTTAPMPTNACSALQHAGISHTTRPDTAAAFLSDPYYTTAAKSAEAPAGYEAAFVNTRASAVAPSYLGYTAVATYDTAACAAKCTGIKGCTAFNIYFERDPSVDPDSIDCANPPSITALKCAWWGSPLSPANSVNSGQFREQFEVVIAGSNGYNRAEGTGI